MSTASSSSSSFLFRGASVPVTYPSAALTTKQAEQVLTSEPFISWVKRCERLVSVSATEQHRLELHSVELQSVDMFGARGVGFVKLKSHCTLTVLTIDAQTGQVTHTVRHDDKPLPGICFLRGNAVSILVALIVTDDDNDNSSSSSKEKEVYSLLVEQPRVPLGQVACLELPAGMVDDNTSTVVGIAIQEMREECGIHIEKPTDLIDLTQLALGDSSSSSSSLRLPLAAIAPSPGGCDEMLKCFYLEKNVTNAQLQQMKGRLQGLRDHGEFITLRVVPINDVWKVSGDVKAMASLFLLNKLRQDHKLPQVGCLATPLATTTTQPRVVSLRNGSFSMPQLAFGMYQIPNDDETGVPILVNAIAAGYRHFDSAEYYGNEEALGKALAQSGIPRSEFFISGKVWKTTMAEGYQAVQASVRNSLRRLQMSYFDLVMLHWPVPGHFVTAYQALQDLYNNADNNDNNNETSIVKALGLSNFLPSEHEELMQSGVVTVPPVCNQLEVSPLMYRPNLIHYYQRKHDDNDNDDDNDMIVVAFKPLCRGGNDIWTRPALVSLARKYRVTVAQLALKWAVQHGCVVVCKTSSVQRMHENRALWHFTISQTDMETVLNQLTTAQDVAARAERERASKQL